jgi:hypothetical protein
MMKWFFLFATAMAARLDFFVGMIIALGIGTITAIEVPLWYLAVGGMLALLPDFDLVFKTLWQWIRGQRASGDHRETIMHCPMVMLPSCTLLAFLLGGWYWATVTLLGLFWHYAHDSKWFGSVGDIDWFAIVPNQNLPYMDTPEWLKQLWLRPTKTSVTELIAGVTMLALVVNAYFGIHIAIILASMAVIVDVMVWSCYFIYRKQAQEV